MKDVVVIGGGLAGLTSSILLARQGLQVLVIEKKTYPFHRVCGEYVSNEVAPFLHAAGLYPTAFEPPQINRFVLSSVGGRQASVPLAMGGFGISRFSFDYFLYQKALEAGVEFELGQSADSVTFDGQLFDIGYGNGRQVGARLAVGAWGKRSTLDKKLERRFMEKKSPFVGVKHHLRTDFPADTIALHNFPGGYCGISRVENNTYNLCYLSTRNNLKQAGSVADMERAFLWQNPRLRSIFENSDFLFEKPEVINEISFERKETSLNGVVMCGDTAGLITPLCGNGMAMAIRSAKILADMVGKQLQGQAFDLEALHRHYREAWRREFATRLWVGRKTQHLFGTRPTSALGVAIVGALPPVARGIISLTHGQPFS